MSKLEITEKERAIMKEFSTCIGEILSYIDITVDSPQPEAKYSKKEQLKKLFERTIYNVRKEILPMTETEIKMNIDTMFGELLVNLNKLSLASLTDERIREVFVTLVGDSIKELQERILNSI